MPPEPVVAAVMASDIHASDKPPIARAEETDWLYIQSGYWRQVSSLCDTYSVPLLLGGDVFDDGWRPSRCSPALINMVLHSMPRRCYGVPGQHDLPHHRLDQIKRSAFWTLVEAGKLIYLESDRPVDVEGRVPLRLWGFPWGTPVTPLDLPHDMVLEVAVIHAMIYTNATKHPGAAEDAYFKNWASRLRGYDVALFGDNHASFERRVGDCQVFNPGSFMRRRVDEADHKPRVGLLYSDGTVKSRYLDVRKDKLTDVPKADNKDSGRGVDEFVAELLSLTDKALDFKEAVLRMLDREKPPQGVVDKVLKALE